MEIYLYVCVIYNSTVALKFLVILSFKAHSFSVFALRYSSLEKFTGIPSLKITVFFLIMQVWVTTSNRFSSS